MRHQRLQPTSISRKKYPSISVSGSSQVNRSFLQRAIEEPTLENLTPDVVSHLQSTHGNQFVNRLMQRAKGNEKTGESTLDSPSVVQRTTSDQVPMQTPQQDTQDTVQREIEYEETGLPVARTLFDDAYNDLEKFLIDFKSHAASRLESTDPDFAEALSRAEYKKAWQNEPMRREMIKQAELEYASESTSFMQEVEKYRGNPDYDKALELYEMYCHKDVSEFEVNLTSKTFRDLASAIGMIQSTSGRGRSNDVVPQGRSRGRGVY